MVTIGSQFSVNQYSSSTTYEIVAPSANTTGIRIKTLYMYVNTGGACALYADTAAPSSAVDKTKRPVAFVSSTNIANNVTNFALPYPLFVPAGLGIWFTGTISGASSTGYSITYDAGPD